MTNITIDDTYGDELTGVLPDYQPPGSWNLGNCSGCGVHLTNTLSFDGTWHDTTLKTDELDQQRNLTARFHGTAVYVFATLVNHGLFPPDIPTSTSLAIDVDGVYTGTFIYLSNDGKDVYYQYPVYSRDSLPDGPHTIVVKVVPGPGRDSSLFLFDYIVYTTTDPGDTAPLASSSQRGTHPTAASPTSSSTSTSTSVPSQTSRSAGTRPPTPAIIGGILGGVGILALGILVLYILRRKYPSPKLREGAQPALPMGPPVYPFPTESSAAHAEPNARTRAWWEVGWGYSKAPSIFSFSPRTDSTLVPGHQTNPASRREGSTSDIDEVPACKTREKVLYSVS